MALKIEIFLNILLNLIKMSLATASLPNRLNEMEVNHQILEKYQKQCLTGKSITKPT